MSPLLRPRFGTAGSEPAILATWTNEGYLFIVGRIKEADVINRGGQKVAPAEVERALLSHPDVVEAAGFSHPPYGDLARTSQSPSCSRPNAKVSVSKLREFAGERLARFKVPGLIRIVPEIPKDPSGKVKRRDLATALSIVLPRTRVERDGKAVAPRSKIERQLAKIWADLLELDEVGVDQDVFALGADSLTVTQMLSRLRARFGVDFSFKDIFDAPTVAALAARLEHRRRRVPLPYRLACAICRLMLAASACHSSSKESMS